MMASEIKIWCTANALVKEHREDAAMIAAHRLAEMQRMNDHEGRVAWERIIQATDAVVKAVKYDELEPALHFTFPNTRTDEENEREMWRYEGRIDYRLEGFDDLPLDSPLIVLQSQTIEEAKIEAERLWAGRSTCGLGAAAPTSYGVSNEFGQVMFFYSATKDE